jgi:(2S)-methylsuccinyl-CoA dehydrogenase
MIAAQRPPAALLSQAQSALLGAEALLAQARETVKTKIAAAGGIDAAQAAAHGLAWVATYVEALRQLLGWARRLEAAKAFGAFEAGLFTLGFGEYLTQLAGGIAMSQGEIARPFALGLDNEAVAKFWSPDVDALSKSSMDDALFAALAAHIANDPSATTFGDIGLDEDMTLIREQFRKFSDAQVKPNAHDWHLKDELIPLTLIQEMAGLGVFGLTIPESFGGAGMGKTAMCVVSEELSRGYIGVGSLGTRSEIAAELILSAGTPEQKSTWLPKIASGAVLPTAVFTEPNTGSDLGSLRTRAKREGDHWLVTGAKTWITHGARADMMTLLVRTNPDAAGYKGLSMFLAEKPRGTPSQPFPAPGMSGGEIKVMGYRGMKEYEIAFDGFRVPHANLLGGEEGQGFKQLMQTFESARIQTAARAIGVAQSALDLGLRYALDRVQFGKPIWGFPRVRNKIVTMAVEIMIARQLTYFAAREKDAGRRCDLEAGMAKLLAARVAWAAADNALQIHGGNGFALEYPISRVLCDARILNIFEGAAEIQAQVIARRLLDDGAN